MASMPPSATNNTLTQGLTGDYQLIPKLTPQHSGWWQHKLAGGLTLTELPAIAGKQLSRMNLSGFVDKMVTWYRGRTRAQRDLLTIIALAIPL
jgi:hypothetical protein